VIEFRLPVSSEHCNLSHMQLVLVRPFIIISILFAGCLFSQETALKKELLILDDDFSSFNWTTLSLTTDTVANFSLSANRFRSPLTAAAIMADHPGAQDAWMISPALSFSGAANPQLEFYEDENFWLFGKSTHEILIATNANPQVDDFTSLITFTAPEHIIQGFNGAPYRLSLGDYGNQEIVHLAFRYISPEGQLADNWYIDDLRITQAVLFDATISSMSLSDGDALSSQTETQLTVYPLNAGTESIAFAVAVALTDFTGKPVNSDTLRTSVLASGNRDTLQYMLPAVSDSSWFQLEVTTLLENDESPENDLSQISLNTYRYPRISLVEAFIESNNPFSEGVALISDSLSRKEGLSSLPVWHFFTDGDTAATVSSRDLAGAQRVRTSFTLLIDRDQRMEMAMTSLQEWQTELTTVEGLIRAQTDARSPLGVSGYVFAGEQDDEYEVDVTVIQKANLPAMNFQFSLWSIEASRAWSWSDQDSLLHRGMELLQTKNMSSIAKGSELLRLREAYKITEGDTIAATDFGKVVIYAILSDSLGRVVNTTRLLAQDPPTGLPELPQAAFASSFYIEGNYPNPLNPSTTVRFYQQSAGRIEIAIYNTLGQRLLQRQAFYAGGWHEWRWQAGNLASGIYILTMRYQDQTQIKRMLLLR
jgi:hypothetical protein